VGWPREYFDSLPSSWFLNIHGDREISAPSLIIFLLKAAEQSRREQKDEGVWR